MLNPIDIKYFKMVVGDGRIKHSSNTDISARCPVCGDSKYSQNKARLHLYNKNNITLVNCFNECSVCNLSMLKFLKNFYPNFYDSYKSEMFGNKIQNLKELNSDELLGDFNIYNFSNSKTAKIPPILFNLEKFFIKSDFSDYLESRNIDFNPSYGNFYIGKNITIDNKNYNIDNYIIIPLYYDNKWYGFYSRSLTEHKFFTYIPDKNQGFKIWNYYNIDYNKPVYVFEGIFDAMSASQCGLTNVVACLGATPPMELLKDLDLVFCLDNDRTGILNSFKYVKMGYKCVVWDDDLPKDCNEMLCKNINIKNEILNNTYSGIIAEIKLKRKL